MPESAHRSHTQEPIRPVATGMEIRQPDVLISLLSPPRFDRQERQRCRPVWTWELRCQPLCKSLRRVVRS